MKHIKLFEAYKDAVDRVINWDLIRDVKEMSLEYIDYDLTLFIRVKQNNQILYQEYYAHSLLRWNIPDRNQASYYYKPIGNACLVYNFRLTDDKNFGHTKIKESDELVERIRCAYPNEIIELV